MDVEDRIKTFRADLPHGNPAANLVRKHITSGECFVLSSADSYFDLKARIAGNLPYST